MVQKLILQPSQVRALVPHFPVLDMEKMKRIKTAFSTTRVKVSDRSSGRHVSAEVLDVPALLTTPVSANDDELYILNGKHRAVWAGLLDINLVVYRIQTRDQLRHCINRSSFGDLHLDALEESFDERQKYIAICRASRVENVADLIEHHRTDLQSLLRSSGRFSKMIA